ncbi:MAG: AMP-binding protein [Planctomycetes bacterium]|nr:AMP-binding protein [Planctomycetota bacterium]MCB9919536.1 AMP-binding protein [Planctomycetota bacterium]
MLFELLKRARDLHGHRDAIRGQAVQLTYRGLYASCTSLAHAWSELGVSATDRVAILSRNSPEYLCAYFASACLGAVLVPLNTRWTSSEIAAVLARSGARLLVFESSFAGLVDQVEHTAERWAIDDNAWSFSQAAHGLESGVRAFHVRRSVDDAAHLYFTSGTTGHPKGVVLTEGNVHAHALAAVLELELEANDTWAHIAPMFHLADAWATFAITLAGGCHVFLSDFDAESALKLLREERVSITNLVPLMLQRMVQSHGERVRGCDSEPTDDTYALRILMSGGAPIAPSLVRRIVEAFDCEYVQTYGMTETSPYLTMSLLDEQQRMLTRDEQLRIRARTGRPFLGTELRVVRDAGGARGFEKVQCDDVDVGEVQVRGPHVTRGYWEDPLATREAFTPDGFLRTGDLATIDASGSIRIVDRIKDVILTGGETVYTTEVESRLYEHASVLEVAVIGVADPTWGERVVAVVVLRPSHEDTRADELIAHCRERLAGYKSPKQIVFSNQLPRMGSGKIDKRALRQTIE